jgi:hypothetical protein
MSKGPNFPVQGRRASIIRPNERPLLLDPTVDQPDAHLEPDLRTGRLKARSLRGEATIDVLNLNRPDLIRQRLAATSSVRIAESQPSGLAQIRKQAFAGQAEFSMFLRKALGLADIVSIEPGWRQSPTPDVLRTPYIRSVVLKNFRAIRSLKIDIASESNAKRPWTMIIGENGAGKSTILQAISLVLLHLTGRSKRAAGLMPVSEVVHDGTTGGYVELHLEGELGVARVLFSRRRNTYEYFGPTVRSVHVSAYGANRLGEHGPHKAQVRDNINIANLFDGYQPLVDATAYLSDLGTVRFDYAAKTLKDILNLDGRSRFERRGRQIILRRYGRVDRLSALSQGFRSTVAMCCDIMSSLDFENTRDHDVAEGIVLLDEIESHMHPRWKMRIVDRLHAAFPRLQFIATTHDPLCLRGMGGGKVTVLRRTPGGKIYQELDLPPVEGLKVDQLLTSEYFGLNSSIDPEIEEKFVQYYELLANPRPSLVQRQRIKILAAELAPLSLPGITRRERLLLQAIDRFLATEQRRSTREEKAVLERTLRGRATRILRGSSKKS